MRKLVDYDKHQAFPYWYIEAMHSTQTQTHTYTHSLSFCLSVLHTYTHTTPCAHACTHAHTHVCTQHTHTHTHTHRVSLFLSLCLAHTHTHNTVCAHPCTHTPTHVRSHKHTHTEIQDCKDPKTKQYLLCHGGHCSRTDLPLAFPLCCLLFQALHSLLHLHSNGQQCTTCDTTPINTMTGIVCSLLVGCLTSQQHASVSQGQICSDKFMCCHTEIEVADPTVHLTQSQYTDTGPTSLSTDSLMPGAWQGSYWSANA